MNSLILATTLVLEFLGPCDSQPLSSQKLEYQLPQNAGVMTIQGLELISLPYSGNERGLNSAFGTPTGMAAMEVISPNEMRSYGWCYGVDGVVPEVFPDQYPLTAHTKKITWFFAYAHFLNGEWIAQCQPAHKLRPEFLCK